MTSRISHTSFDASDAYAQSLFWSRVLDFVEDPGDPNEPGHEECLITSRDSSQMLLFITVPDGRQVKNRIAAKRCVFQPPHDLHQRPPQVASRR